MVSAVVRVFFFFAHHHHFRLSSLGVFILCCVSERIRREMRAQFQQQRFTRGVPQSVAMLFFSRNLDNSLNHDETDIIWWSSRPALQSHRIRFASGNA